MVHLQLKMHTAELQTYTLRLKCDIMLENTTKGVAALFQILAAKITDLDSDTWTGHCDDDGLIIDHISIRDVGTNKVNDCEM